MVSSSPLWPARMQDISGIRILQLEERDGLPSLAPYSWPATHSQGSASVGVT